jgi:hypothetical protein
MIEAIEGLPDGTIGARFSGEVIAEDYSKTMIPLLEDALRSHDKLKVLVVFDEGFTGYAAGAVWEDSKLGIQHWRGFERIAVVSDTDWIETMVKAGSFMMPCPVRTFDLDETDEARRWLGESLGSIRINQSGKVVTIGLIGELDTEAYDGKSDELDDAMAAADPARLIIDLREFDSWSGISAIADHIALGRAHRKVPLRVAIVGDKDWQEFAATHIAPKVISGETRFFESDDFADATQWVNG